MAGPSDKASPAQLRLRFQPKNPKAEGSSAFERYDKYKQARTLKKALELGALRGDLKHDWRKGFLQTDTGDCPVELQPRRLGVEAWLLRKPAASALPAEALNAGVCPSQSSTPRKRPAGCATEETPPKLSEEASADPSQSSAPRKRPAGCTAEEAAAAWSEALSEDAGACSSQSSAPRKRPAGCIVEEAAAALAREPPSEEAKTLATECQCDAELAQTAIGMTECIDAAKSLLMEGPAAAYSSERQQGELPGDEVFRHPYVQCLAEVAQRRVLQVLASQKEPKQQRWLLCVRSYGRAGNPPGFKKKCGGHKYKSLVEMTLQILQCALGPKAHTHCLIFVSHEDEDVVSGRYAAALKGTPWEGQVILGVKGADRQVRFIDSVVPEGTHVVVADDNIVKLSVEYCATHPKDLEYCERPLHEPLADLIQLAGREMAATGANLWGVSPTKNHYFLHTSGEQFRRRSKKKGVYREYSKRLGLVYGAFFGFRATHDARRYTRYGQVKDDVERTLRYWHCDGVALRFMRYGTQKNRKPGTYHTSKGGISAGSSADVHGAEGRRALDSMISEFAWRYVRLPKEDANERVSDVGLIWAPERAVRQEILVEQRKKLSLQRAEARRLRRQERAEAKTLKRQRAKEAREAERRVVRRKPSGAQPSAEAPRAKEAQEAEKGSVMQKPSGKDAAFIKQERLRAQRRLQISKAREKLAEKRAAQQAQRPEGRDADAPEPSSG